MPTIALRLDPRMMANPDLDIRYALPDLLVDRSGGILADDGYDYVRDAPFLVLFLKTSDEEKAVAFTLEAIDSWEVLDNDLRLSTVVAIDRGQGYEVVYPTTFDGTFEI